MMRTLALLVGLTGQLWGVSAQTWCGKNYMVNQSIVPPGGEFSNPKSSSEPLLAFRCSPAIKPYLAEDSTGAFIIDTQVTNTGVAGTSIIRNVHASSELHVTIAVNGHTLASGTVPLNASAHELSFSLKSLNSQHEAFDVECTAETTDGQMFKANTTLLKLPNRTDGGSVTKMDLRTGAMLVQNSSSREWEAVFPLGFYTSFDGYLDSNLSVLNDIKDRGLTIVHPVPTFDNLTVLNEVLDRMEEVGLYLMYDMRYTYMNTTSVTEQVNMIKTRKNLLLWYTGDEPDGTSDPLNATQISYDLIKSLDGSYHPVSLVLNCENYYFSEYIQGADVVMQDTYPIAVNTTFSAEWHTPCTLDFGCCGCDDCHGNFDDIVERMDVFAYRLNALGENRAKTVWAVPQAFGGSEYWTRAPTGNEWLVESILSINHGATGIVPWDDPTPPDIKDAATSLAQALPAIKSFIFDPTHLFSSVLPHSFIDVGLWTVGNSALLLATNKGTSSVSAVVIIPNGVSGESARQILNSGGLLKMDESGKTMTLSLNGLGSVGFIIS